MASPESTGGAVTIGRMTRTTGIGRRLRGAARAGFVALCAAGCAGLDGIGGGGGGSGGGDPDRPREPRDPGSESGDGDSVGDAAVGRAELIPKSGPLRRVRIADTRLRVAGKYGDVGIPMAKVARFYRSASQAGAFVLVTTEGDRVIGAPPGDGVDLEAKGGGTVRVPWTDIRELRPNAPDTGDDAPATFSVVVTENEDLYVARSVDEKARALAVVMRCGPRVEVPIAEVKVSASGVRRFVLGDSGELGYDSESAKNGRRIVRIFPGGAAERAGLREGDVIVKLSGRLLKKGESLSTRREEIVRGTAVYGVIETVRGDDRPVYLLTR